jgi:hypothetical protein
VSNTGSIKQFQRFSGDLSSNFLPKKGSPEENSIVSQPDLRLISHWNQTLASGSFRVGITSRFQAHFRIGKCSFATDPIDSAKVFEKYPALAPPVKVTGNRENQASGNGVFRAENWRIIAVIEQDYLLRAVAPTVTVGGNMGEEKYATRCAYRIIHGNCLFTR